MRIALMGSVSSSEAALRGLLDVGADVAGVLGLAPEAAGRVSGFVSLEPIAREARVPFQPFAKVREPAVRDFLERCRPDVLLVVGLSQLVPESLIGLARHGGVGYHPTPLPEGRGRAPIAWTILLQRPAVPTLFVLTAEPDAGNVLAQVHVAQHERETAGSLLEKTNAALRSLVGSWCRERQAADMLRGEPQDPARATWYPKRSPADGVIDWAASTERLDRFVRATGRPHPGAFTTLRGQGIVLWRAEPGSRRREAAPGTVLAADAAGFEVASGDGSLVVQECEGPAPRPGDLLDSVDGGTWDDPAVPPPSARGAAAS